MWSGNWYIANWRDGLFAWNLCYRECGGLLLLSNVMSARTWPCTPRPSVSGQFLGVTCIVDFCVLTCTLHVYICVYIRCTDVYTVGVSENCTHSKRTRAKLRHIFLSSVTMLTSVGWFVFQLIPNKGDISRCIIIVCGERIPLLHSECDINVDCWCSGWGQWVWRVHVQRLMSLYLQFFCKYVVPWIMFIILFTNTWIWWWILVILVFHMALLSLRSHCCHSSCVRGRYTSDRYGHTCFHVWRHSNGHLCRQGTIIITVCKCYASCENMTIKQVNFA